MGQGFMSKIESKMQEKVMSLLFRGKEIFKPLNTGHIDERVSCLREYVDLENMLPIKKKKKKTITRL